MDSFTILEDLSSTSVLTASRAIHRETSKEVRLTRMSSSTCASADFRAAFRTDLPKLIALDHRNVLQPLFWGEDNGLLFFATEFHGGTTLQQRLDDGAPLTWDEFVDVGWQIASALQHCHNSGMPHGHLTPSSVLISDDFRIKVAGFGLSRWIKVGASDDSQSTAFSRLAIRDLAELGTLLDTIQNTVAPESAATADNQQLTNMQDLIRKLKSPRMDFTARDVQGRLGNMLLDASGESIEMIDDRSGQGLSRRSLVDELFDETLAEPTPPLAPSARSAQQSKTTALRILILTVLLVLLLILCFMQRP